MSKAKGMFDMIYSANAELLKTLRKGSVKRKLKRKFQAAWDQAHEAIAEQKELMQKNREELESYDCSVVVNADDVIKQHENVKRALEEEYLKMFGEVMPHEDVDDDDEEDGTEVTE